MNERKNKIQLILIALLVVNLCISGFLAAYLFLPESSKGTLDFNQSESNKYTFYIGTNDKNTGQPIIDTKSAADIVNQIFLKNNCGFTRWEATGGWGENGQLILESTLVYTLLDASEEQVSTILQEIEKALSQSAILVEMENASSTYFNGDIK